MTGQKPAGSETRKLTGALRTQAGLAVAAETRRTTTVIIPTYNRAELLRECLVSILQQTLPVDRIIVVDDGSTDHTPLVMRLYAGKVDYVRRTNQGKSAALNAILPDVATSHVWIVDDDDIVLSDAHARLDAALRKSPRAGIAYGRHLRFRREVPDGALIVMDGGYWRHVRSDEFLTATMEDMFAHQSGMLVASWVLRSAGPFREDLIRSQDYEMLLRLAERTSAVEAEGFVFMQRIHEGVRGTSEQKLCASRRDEAWISHDRDFLAERLMAWPLSSYLPGGRYSSKPADLRRALIQRAVVAARHKLWPIAVKDLRYAALIEAGNLTGAEKAILLRAAHSKFGCPELFEDPELGGALRALAASGPVAAEIVFLIARGSIWRARRALFEGRLESTSRILLSCMRYCMQRIMRVAGLRSDRAGDRVSGFKPVPLATETPR